MKRQFSSYGRTTIASLVALVALVTCSAAAEAQYRTWVSGVGDDANPCSRTAPCKTFAGAIFHTSPGGEIDVMDSGAYGTLTITKSVSIEAVGTVAGVQAQGTDGIVIQAGPADVVVIRGLTFEGLGNFAKGSFNGIKFVSGGALFVENCTINNFNQKNIDFEPNQAGNSYLLVSDSIIRNSNTDAQNGSGIVIAPTGGGTAFVNVDRTLIERNISGLIAKDNSKVTVRNSTANGNQFSGFAAISAGLPVELNLIESTSSNNGTNGVNVSGANATVRIENVMLTDNANGLNCAPSGQIVYSWGNNYEGGSTTMGINGCVIKTLGQF